MFSQFPEFGPLSYPDQNKYNQLIEHYPPLSDLSFTTLQLWWNPKISSLGGNLIIWYHQPFDVDNSGLGIVGSDDIDRSSEIIFKYLLDKGLPPKLVHVPEFVVNEIKDKPRFVFHEENDYNEYILDCRRLGSLDTPDYSRIRRKVGRFNRETVGNQVSFFELNLAPATAQQAVIDAYTEWTTSFPNKNDPQNIEESALRKAVEGSLQLGVRCLVLTIDNKMSGFCLFHQPVDPKYLIINHLRVDYSTPFIFDFMTHQVARWAVKENARFLNFEMDLGIEGLRRHKMGLRPIGFFKKFTISPA